MSGRRRFICPNGFHRATRLCFRAFDAMKLMTSGASPIAQMSGAVSARHGNSCLTREGCGPGTRPVDGGSRFAWGRRPLHGKIHLCVRADERRHEIILAKTLETHIRDIAGCIEAEELDQIIPVRLLLRRYGHHGSGRSDGRNESRLSSYLDAFVPEHGDSCNCLLPKALA